MNICSIFTLCSLVLDCYELGNEKSSWTWQEWYQVEAHIKTCDLDFADDIALLSASKQQIQDTTSRLDEEARRVRLKINIEKTKVVRINARNQENI